MGGLVGREKGKKWEMTDEETSHPIALSFSPTLSTSPSGARRLAVK